jgi:K+-sensing histidine kinase KdpD
MAMVIEVSNTVDFDKSPDPDMLFKAYYRHNNVQEQPGMGLGLSLCKSAADKIFATIDFSLQKNVLLFTLKMPL